MPVTLVWHCRVPVLRSYFNIFGKFIWIFKAKLWGLLTVTLIDTIQLNCILHSANPACIVIWIFFQLMYYCFFRRNKTCEVRTNFLKKEDPLKRSSPLQINGACLSLQNFADLPEAKTYRLHCLTSFTPQLKPFSLQNFADLPEATTYRLHCLTSSTPRLKPFSLQNFNLSRENRQETNTYVNLNF